MSAAPSVNLNGDFEQDSTASSNEVFKVGGARRRTSDRTANFKNIDSYQLQRMALCLEALNGAGKRPSEDSNEAEQVY